MGMGRQMMKKKMGRILMAIAVLVTVTAFLTACGSKEPDDEEDKDWSYVSEFFTDGIENVSWDDMRLSGEYVYYFCRNSGEGGYGLKELCRYSFVDGQVASIPLDWQEGDTGELSAFTVGEDGGICLIASREASAADTGENAEPVWFLCKFDALGNQIFSRDMSAEMKDFREKGAPGMIAADDRGNLYVGNQGFVWIYDGEGNYQGSVSAGAPEYCLTGIGCGRDGRIYTAAYLSGGQVNFDSMNYTLTELDGEKMSRGAAYADFPCNSVITGKDTDFLAWDADGVYGYDIGTQSRELLFNWMDCNIIGSDAGILGTLADGRLVAAYTDWQNDISGIALLTKTPKAQIEAKEDLVLATMSADSRLQSAVVNFNKNSGKYRISVKEYYDHAGGITWQDALTKLKSDIVSENCPDLIDLYHVDIAGLAAKGVLEDLNPFLEKSSVLGREDILGSILDAYTFGDILACIPDRFMIRTVVGAVGEIDGRKSWTIDDVIAFADAHPQAELFDKARKSQIMEYLMLFNEEAFIDWEAGTCSFDSDRFKRLLEFVNRFPEENEGGNEGPVMPVRIQNGEVLLASELFMGDFNQIQLYREMFQSDVVCIGYPAADGRGVHGISSPSQIYGISSKSAAKEGAWEFIESILVREPTGWDSFPSLKRSLDEMVQEALYTGYVLDEQGEPLLDEKGDPVMDEDAFDSISYGSNIVMGGNISGNHWTYTYHTPSREEIELVLEMIDGVRLVPESNEEMMSIINEEAEAFYQGQKTVDEVAEIIQSRMGIYVNTVDA